MIELKNLTVSFGGKRVIDDVSLIFPKNGLVVISGPSGCGKTTFLRTLMGLQKYKGEIKMERNTVFSAVFQESNLMPWLTAVENVAAVTDINDDNINKAKNLLFDLGFNDDDVRKRPAELSVGMMRRVAAARAMMIDADVLILDEPFAGLDDDNISVVSDLLLSKRDKQLVILVTHIGDFSADKIYTVADGKLI